MGDGLNPITGGTKNLFSLDAERRRAESAAEPDPGASSYVTAEKPAKILGTDRWNVRHVNVDDLPVVDPSEIDASSVPLPTTEPPILPHELSTEPTRPDFAALMLTYANESRTLFAAHMNRFKRWWDSTYYTLVYHAASRIGRGGTSAELDVAFKAGELAATADASPTSPYAATLVDRLRFLQASLFSDVPLVKQRGTERAALMLEYLKDELNEGERLDVARTLVAAGRDLIDAQDDQDDALAAAIVMQRTINAEWRVGSIEDVIRIAQTVRNSLSAEDTPASIGALEAFEGIIRMVPRDDDGDVRTIIESSRGMLGCIAREGASDRVKQCAKSVFDVIEERFPHQTAQNMHEAILRVSDAVGAFEAGARMNIGMPAHLSAFFRVPFIRG